MYSTMIRPVRVETQQAAASWARLVPATTTTVVRLEIRVMKRVWVGTAVLGTVGLLTAIVLTVIEGAKYRVREEQGLEPVSAPDLVAVTTYAGLAVFAVAVAALLVIGIVALVHGRGRTHRSNPDWWFGGGIANSRMPGRSLRTRSPGGDERPPA